MRRFLLAAAAVAVVAAPASAASAKTAFGVIDNTDSFQNPAQFWSDYSALHMKAYRVDALWSDIAPAQPANALDPNDPAYNWTYLDLLVRNAAAHKATGNLVMTVWRTPRWASQYGGKYTTVDAFRIKAMPKPALYAQFVHAIAVRYSGTFIPTGSTTPLPAVRKWQVWNEPNTYLVPWKVGGKFVVASNYNKLLKAAYPAFKAVSKKNIVSNGGFGPSGQHQVPLEPFNFIKALGKLKPKIDVLSVHAYGGVPGLGIRDGATIGTKKPSLAPGSFKAFLKVADTALHHKYRVWVTEFGWQTKPEDKTIGVTHLQQAQFMKSMFALLRSTKRVDIGIWFLMKDEVNVAGWQSGVRTASGTKKTIYAYWKKYGK
jgi:hypothetical protein